MVFADPKVRTSAENSKPALTMAESEKTPKATPRSQRAAAWKPGQSGNPKRRPVRARNKTTVAVEGLLAGEAEAITRKVVAMAKRGNITAIRLVLDRISPPRKDRPVPFKLPKDRDGRRCCLRHGGDRQRGRGR
jgi:hypothetical protein